LERISKLFFGGMIKMVDWIKGVFTAIITPFDNNGEVDYSALKKLIDYNIENGVSGIVPCGTTGESPTLNHDEHEKVIEETIKHVNGRVKVIAGTGSNSTVEAISLSKEAEKSGADGLLIVNPYYNKPTQKGLYLHFKAINDVVSIPIVVYNIKGRTGINVETQTLLKLINDCENIVAVKEASGDLEQISEVIEKTPENFSVMSGDDNIALKVIRLGGQGVISVASNLIPKQMSEMIGLGLNGEIEKAEEFNEGLKKMFEIEFIETNPIPIKYMLSKKGFCEEIYRLPMCELSEENKKIVDEFLEGMVI
jgi:4-hydroxy-tetrahydrodipicolinate synthase